MTFYKDYFWSSFKPKGTHKLSSHKEAPLCYKIVSDPYGKRYSIEQYKNGLFYKIFYDSALFDFRHLLANDPTKAVWHTEIIETFKAHIRDEYDRLILIESYTFNESLCRETTFTTPHGIFIGRQKMFYTKLNDPLDGVVLFDQANKPVLIQLYHTDNVSGAYTKIGEVIKTPHRYMLHDQLFLS